MIILIVFVNLVLFLSHTQRPDLLLLDGEYKKNADSASFPLFTLL